MAQKLKVFNEYLYENEVRWANNVLLRQAANGQWHEITWKEAMLQARKMSSFLKSLGLKKGDKVAILSKNCAEWIMADFAIAMAGCVSVPLYAAQLADTISYILDHSESKAIFVGKLDNWQSQEKAIPKDMPRIAFPYENPMPAKYTWKEIQETFEPDISNYVPDVEDLYTLMYTSGTTGNPKGVMITFEATGNLMQISHDKEHVFDAVEHQYFMSYLPLGHIFERIAVEATSLFFKTTISFAESLATFAHNLEETQPTIFQAAPRILTQFQKAVLAKMPEKRLDFLLKIPLLNSFIKKKIRHSLGLSRCYWIVSGSAPMSMPLLEWYKKLGITVCEGYGRTEDLAWCTIQMTDECIFGTVGKPRPTVELKLGENDELLTRSKGMMKGYYKDPEATKKVFTEDGFIRTGDAAIIHKNGYLTILGRVNDTFKTDKGEFVNPLKLEDMFAKNSDIEQLCIIGLTLPQPVLLVVLSQKAHSMHNREELNASLNDTLNQVNSKLSKFETVKHIIVCKEAWTPDNDLLTPTFKMRRSVIHHKYIELARKVSDTDQVIYWE